MSENTHQLNSNLRVVRTEVRAPHYLNLTIELQNGLRILGSTLIDLNISQVPDDELNPDPNHYNHHRFHGYLMVNELGIPGAHYHADDPELLVFPKGSLPVELADLALDHDPTSNVLGGQPLSNIDRSLNDYLYYEPLEDDLAGALSPNVNESHNVTELLAGYITYLNDRFPA